MNERLSNSCCNILSSHKHMRTHNRNNKVRRTSPQLCRQRLVAAVQPCIAITTAVMLVPVAIPIGAVVSYHLRDHSSLVLPPSSHLLSLTTIIIPPPRELSCFMLPVCPLRQRQHRATTLLLLRHHLQLQPVPHYCRIKLHDYVCHPITRRSHQHPVCQAHLSSSHPFVMRPPFLLCCRHHPCHCFTHLSHRYRWRHLLQGIMVVACRVHPLMHMHMLRGVVSNLPHSFHPQL